MYVWWEFVGWNFVDQNFWAKFRFSANQIFSIFKQNSICEQNFHFFEVSKVYIFDGNVDFGSKIRFSISLLIFDQSFEISLSIKMYVEYVDFWPKFKILPNFRNWGTLELSFHPKVSDKAENFLRDYTRVPTGIFKKSCFPLENGLKYKIKSLDWYSVQSAGGLVTE